MKKLNLFGRRKTAAFQASLKGLIDRRNALVKSRIMDMHAIHHDGKNAYTAALATLFNAAGAISAENKGDKQSILAFGDKIKEAHAASEKILNTYNSKMPYLWKRWGAAFRARGVIRKDMKLLSEMKKLKSLPGVAGNEKATARLSAAENNIVDHMHRYGAFFSRKLDYTGDINEVDPNRFIKSFLQMRGEIIDKAGHKVIIDFRGGNAKAVEIAPDDLVRVLDNLLTDALAHQKMPRVEITTETRGENTIIKFLSINGEPISDDVLPKIGREQYSITGSKSKGIGKMSVHTIAQKYDGGLTIKNSPRGPFLEVSFKAA